MCVCVSVYMSTNHNVDKVRVNSHKVQQHVSPVMYVCVFVRMCVTARFTAVVEEREE